MIISSFESIPLGVKVIAGLSDSKGEFHIIPVVAIAVATRNDYLQYVAENGEVPLSFTEQELSQLKYYRVSVD